MWAVAAHYFAMAHLEHVALKRQQVEGERGLDALLLR
jgi:hypothetical protein